MVWETVISIAAGVAVTVGVSVTVAVAVAVDVRVGVVVNVAGSSETAATRTVLPNPARTKALTRAATMIRLATPCVMRLVPERCTGYGHA